MVSRSVFVLACTVLLAACDPAKAPEQVTEVATEGVHTITLNHSGTAAFVGSLHHGGSYWTLNPTERHYDWNHSGEGYSSLISAAFAPRDDYLASADKRTIVLWKVSTGEAVWYWRAPGDIEDMALTPNGNLALLGLNDYTATLFDIRNGGIRHRLTHDDIVYDVSISDNGLLGATASGDTTAALWNLNDGRQQLSLPHGNRVKTAQLSANGRLLFTSAQGEPGRIWDATSGNAILEVGGGRGHYSAARFHSGGDYLVTGHTNGLIQLWQLSSGDEIQRWRATPGQHWTGNNVLIEDVAFNDQGSVAAAANGRIYVMPF